MPATCFASLPPLFPKAPGGRHPHKPTSQMGKLRLGEVTNTVKFKQSGGSQARLGQFWTRTCKLLIYPSAPRESGNERVTPCPAHRPRRALVRQLWWGELLRGNSQWDQGGGPCGVLRTRPWAPT